MRSAETQWILPPSQQDPDTDSQRHSFNLYAQAHN